ncbi:hypothetical protein Tco_0626897 [Tanacetum coccineum]|uniref:Uncharacterized protein n=1 Tax=Tanacetum coccineum TaxID=301880 RepID=A0ABQ4WKU5_9ASTR
MSGIEKGVVYLNQHNRRSLMKINDVKKFCNGTLMKIRENLIDMVNKNELGQVMKSREQLRRFEEYVGGRPKTIDPRFYVMMEPDINNMTLNEYLMHEGRHRDLARNYTSRKSVAPVRNRILVYPDSDEEDEEYCSLPPLLPCFQTPQPCIKFNSISHNVENEININSMTLADFEEILDDLIRIGGENLRSMEHEEVPNRCDEETDDENIHISTIEEIEEVQVKDVRMDENHNIDPSNTKETSQMSLAKDPFLVCMELNDQSNSVQHTIPSSTSNKGKREFTTPHMKHFKAELGEYHIDDDEVACDCGCCSRKQTWSMALSMLSLYHTEQIQGSTSVPFLTLPILNLYA